MRIFLFVVSITFMITSGADAFFRRPIMYVSGGGVPVTLARDAVDVQSCPSAPRVRRVVKTRAAPRVVREVVREVEPLYVREVVRRPVVRVPAILPGVEVVVRQRLRDRIQPWDVYASGDPCDPALGVAFPARRVPLINVLGLGLWLGGW